MTRKTYKVNCSLINLLGLLLGGQVVNDYADYVENERSITRSMY